MLVAYSDYAFEGAPSTDLLLLARSVRSFAGGLAGAPIRLYLAEGRGMDGGLVEGARELEVEPRSYRPEPGLAALPFAQKAIAAAAAEAEAVAVEAAGEGRAQLLWFDRDSLVTGDLSPLVLGPGEDFGYRPVNRRSIGDLAAEPPSAFWARCYELGGLRAEGLGATRAYLGGEELRFYAAAGIAGVRPERGVLRRWAELCRLYAGDARLAEFVRQSPAHRLFLHQAAFSVAAASLAPETRRREYPAEVMYPLNLWSTDDPGRRPARIEEVLSLRYDECLEGEAWRDFPMSEAFEAWLAPRIRGG